MTRLTESVSKRKMQHTLAVVSFLINLQEQEENPVPTMRMQNMWQKYAKFLMTVKLHSRPQNLVKLMSVAAERFRMAPHTLWLFSAEIPLYAPRVKMFLECSILLTGSRNSAPEPAAACARGKRRSRHTGKACCGSPADRGTARWAPVPAAPAPAGKAQSPCRRAEWGT